MTESVIRCWVVELGIVVVIERGDIVGARSYEVCTKEWRGAWRTAGRVDSQGAALHVGRLLADVGTRTVAP